jgi:hypothetical protein
MVMVMVMMMTYINAQPDETDSATVPFAIKRRRVA